MKQPKWKDCTEEDVWKYVGWHLAKNGIETILVGGAVAAIYSEGAYKSGDLDFVLRTYIDGKIPALMADIGFERKSGRHFIHPECDKYIEFVTGPVAIGDDLKITPDAKVVHGQTLYIYNPTDCIRDRLASYIHFKARECLDQAVLVAKNFPFNQKVVQEWCKAEGAPEVFKELMKGLAKQNLI